MLKYNIDSSMDIYRCVTFSSTINERLTQGSLCRDRFNEGLDCSLLLRIIKHDTDDELTPKIQLMVEYSWFDHRTCIQSEVECFHDEYEDICFVITFVLTYCFSNSLGANYLVL